MIVPAEVPTVDTGRRVMVTPVAATPVATAGSPAASRATARSGLTRAWCRISAPSIGRARPGISCSTWPGFSHSTAGRLVRGEPAVVRGQAEPVELDQADPAGQRLLQVPPPLQAGPLQVDERLGVAPLVRLGDQQAGGAAGGARRPGGRSRSAAPSRARPRRTRPRWPRP